MKELIEKYGFCEAPKKLGDRRLMGEKVVRGQWVQSVENAIVGIEKLVVVNATKVVLESKVERTAGKGCRAIVHVAEYL